VKTTPTVAVVDRSGRQVAVYEGFFPPDSNEYGKFFARLLKAVKQGFAATAPSNPVARARQFGFRQRERLCPCWLKATVRALGER
jgi:hypothetical protein